VRGHTTGLRASFQNFDAVSRLQSMKPRGKAHCTGSNDDNLSDKAPLTICSRLVLEESGFHENN